MTTTESTTMETALKNAGVLKDKHDRTTPHPYKVGMVLHLFGERNLFGGWGQLCPAKSAADLHLVTIKVIEQRTVKGVYEPKDRYTGYRALGNDGFHYLCNFDSFDEASMSPHANWQREYIEGVHYIEDTTQSKDDMGNYPLKWLVPGASTDKYFFWEVTSILRGFAYRQPELVHNIIENLAINDPDNRIVECSHHEGEFYYAYGYFEYRVNRQLQVLHGESFRSWNYHNKKLTLVGLNKQGEYLAMYVYDARRGGFAVLRRNG